MSTVVQSATGRRPRSTPRHAHPATPDRELEHYRAGLTAVCRRLVGSSDADDAVQETLVRAWLAFDRFEGRAALGSWLHRIAYNVCLDFLEAKQRRAQGLEVLASNLKLPAVGAIEGETGVAGDLAALENPADSTVARETVRLAFSALMCLPPRQRAVLILRDVLRCKAVEVAELLGITVASVNSALQRARSTLAAREPGPVDACPPSDVALRDLLARCIDAFERYDLELLTTLLRDDMHGAAPRQRTRQAHARHPASVQRDVDLSRDRLEEASRA